MGDSGENIDETIGSSSSKEKGRLSSEVKILIQTAARRFFLKSSIPDIHKRGRYPSYQTISVKTKETANIVNASG
jgi:hypothetical protein